MPELTQCKYCRMAIESRDRFCRYCGKDQQKVPFYLTHAGIITAMLLVGPLALWQVYRSPVLSRQGRLIYLLLIAVQTLLFVYLTVEITTMLFNSLQTQLQTFEELGMH